MVLNSVIIIGGSGKVAKKLTTQLLNRTPKTTVYSVIRSEKHIPDLTTLGAHPILQSVEDATVSDLAATIKAKSPDAVVWLAGAGGGSPERTDKVDHEGAIKVMDALAEQPEGKRRFVMVSCLDLRDRERKKVPEWYKEEDVALSGRMWNIIEAYMRAKFAADKELVEENGKRGLKYTIVRPGHLGDEAGTGIIRAGKVGVQGIIPRDDVAKAIIECLENDGSIGLAIDILGKGEGELPVKDAIARVVKEREDCFEGFH